MQTMNVTEGRAKLGQLLKRALKGEDIGLVCDGQVVALRPVRVYSEDYALSEYGLTAEQASAASARIHAEIKAQREAGEVTEFKPGAIVSLAR